MYIEHLSLTNFRNYARLELRVPTGTTVLHGGNAQGKTSLLEAIYYLVTSRSPYTTSDRQLIHWRAEEDPIPYTHIMAEVSTKQNPLLRIDITLLLDRTPDGAQRFRKVIKLNGVEKRVMDLVGLLNAVLFLPRDLTLIEGAPSDRRRFMNDTLSQVDKTYLDALQRYEKILPQRNALLRRIGERQASVKELAYWDKELVEVGSVLVAGRQRFLRELEVEARKIHYELTGKLETLTLEYVPSFTPTASGDGQLSFNTLGFDLHRELTADQIAPQFADQLVNEQRDSIQRGATLSGPHRDELRIHINERDASLYGSRGQARTAVMALKLAELAWMQTHIGESPILLLDEVVAELDAKRRAYLLDRISNGAQTLMTTTELEIFTDRFLAQATRLHIQDGQIASES